MATDTTSKLGGERENKYSDPFAVTKYLFLARLDTSGIVMDVYQRALGGSSMASLIGNATLLRPELCKMSSSLYGAPWTSSREM